MIKPGYKEVIPFTLFYQGGINKLLPSMKLLDSFTYRLPLWIIGFNLTASISTTNSDGAGVTLVFNHKEDVIKVDQNTGIISSVMTNTNSIAGSIPPLEPGQFTLLRGCHLFLDVGQAVGLYSFGVAAATCVSFATIYTTLSKPTN